MSSETTDTRNTFVFEPDSLGGWPLLTPSEMDDLRNFLEDVLQIPAHARRFSVTFEPGKPIILSIDVPVMEAS